VTYHQSPCTTQIVMCPGSSTSGWVGWVGAGRLTLAQSSANALDAPRPTSDAVMTATTNALRNISSSPSDRDVRARSGDSCDAQPPQPAGRFDHAAAGRVKGANTPQRRDGSVRLAALE